MIKTSYNNKLILEPYTKTALETKEQNGWAKVGQRTAVKGLKVLMNAELSGDRFIAAGSIAYIQETLLHTAEWANKRLESDAVEGKFIIVDMINVDFITQDT